MSIVITTSYGVGDCEQAQEALAKFGLSPPGDGGAPDDSPVELARRYQGVYSSVNRGEERKKAVEIGEAWRSAASRIVLSNAGLAPWGWADPSNLYMLDFWRSFEPSSRFLLVYTSPSKAIAGWMKGRNPSPEALAREAGNWAKFYSDALDFYHRNSDVAVLAHIDAVVKEDQFSPLAERRLLLKAECGESSVDPGKNESARIPAVLSVIAEAVVQDSHEALTIFQELESSADLSTNERRSQSATAAAAWLEYGGLDSRAKLEDTQRQLENTAKELEQSRAQTSKSHAQAESLKSSLETTEKSLKSRGQDLESTQNQLNTSREELQAKTRELQAKQEALDLKNEAFESSREELQSKTLELQAKQEALDLKNEAFESSREELQSKTLELQAKQEALDLKNEAFESSREELQAKTLELQAKQEALDLKSEAFESSREELQAKTRELQAMQQALKLKNEAFESSQKALHVQSQDSQAALDDSRKDLQTQKSIVADLQSQLEQEREQGRLAVADAGSRISELEAEIEHNRLLHDEAAEASRSELEKLQSELEQTETNRDEVLHNSNIELTKLQSELERVSSKHEEVLKSYDIKLETLQAELQLANENRTELSRGFEQRLQELQEQQDEAQAKLTEFQVDNDALLDALNTGRREQEEMTIVIERMDSELNTALSLNEVQYSQIEELEQELERFHRLHNEAMEVIKELSSSRTHEAAHSENLDKVRVALEGGHTEFSSFKMDLKGIRDEVRQFANVQMDMAAKLQQAQQAIINAEAARSAEAPAPDHSVVRELVEENSLLAQQLNEVQDELKRYYAKFQEAKKTLKSAAKPVPKPAQKQAPKPKQAPTLKSSLEIDMIGFIEGRNWHNAEDDGRWAGPGLLSTVQVPKLKPGRYRFETEVLSAMSRDIVQGMTVRLNGQIISTKEQILTQFTGPLAPLRRFKAQMSGAQNPYPILISGVVDVADTQTAKEMVISFEFPKTISPADFGESDTRKLAIRIRSIALTQA